MTNEKDEYIKQLEERVSELEEQLHDYVSINAESYVYKIVNPEGLYSKGGAYPTFTKHGKTWTTFGRAKAHLSMFASYTRRGVQRREIYKDCKIVKVCTIQAESFDIIIDNDNEKIIVDDKHSTSKI